MTLINLNSMLLKAKKEKYAVGAFNVTNTDMICGIIRAAEKEKSPVILQYAEADHQRIPLEVIGPFMVNEAKKASVPIAVHFDHGKSFEFIIRALRIGFSSVMFDGSELPYDENIVKTREIIKIAHACNVSVEAEIGRMIRSENEANSSNTAKLKPEDCFTDPEIAKKFASETNVDLLAVSFGTVHGVYKSKPNLDFERLRKISKLVQVPLVMHGGSGLLDEEYREAVRSGIQKINYYSDMSYRATLNIVDMLNRSIKENRKVFLHDITSAEISFVQNEVSNKMAVFGSSRKA